MNPVKITQLIEMLESAKERLGDVEVYSWDSNTKGLKQFPITGINCEGDHIELTN